MKAVRGVGPKGSRLAGHRPRGPSAALAGRTSSLLKRPRPSLAAPLHPTGCSFVAQALAHSIAVSEAKAIADVMLGFSASRARGVAGEMPVQQRRHVASAVASRSLARLALSDGWGGPARCHSDDRPVAIDTVAATGTNGFTRAVGALADILNSFITDLLLALD